MKFKVYARRFDDFALIVGEVEVSNPQYEGKCNLFLEILGCEVIDSGLIPIDAQFWVNADKINRSEYSIIVHELGGRQKIEDMLDKVLVRETKKCEVNCQIDERKVEEDMQGI